MLQIRRDDDEVALVDGICFVSKEKIALPLYNIEKLCKWMCMQHALPVFFISGQ